MIRILRLVVVTLSLLAASCQKAKHSVRFINNYSLPVTEVKVGTLVFGDLATGQASSYQSISAGTHTITGNCSTGYLQGSVSISGKGDNVWTLELNADKTITLIQDK